MHHSFFSVFCILFTLNKWIYISLDRTVAVSSEGFYFDVSAVLLVWCFSFLILSRAGFFCISPTVDDQPFLKEIFPVHCPLSAQLCSPVSHHPTPPPLIAPPSFFLVFLSLAAALVLPKWPDPCQENSWKDAMTASPLHFLKFLQFFFPFRDLFWLSPHFL